MDASNSQKETNDLLKEILKTLQRIESNLTTINRSDELSNSPQEIKEEKHTLDVMELMTLLSEKDDHLIPTIKALLTKKDGGSAQDIAVITKRSRSRENQHLNKLVELGYVHKQRDGREIKFILFH